MLIYTLPLIGALIGWLTNYIAVKMLFHPRKERRFLFVRLQGIFPKRQAALAEKIGELVATELLSAQDVKQKLKDNATSPEVMKAVGEHIDKAIMVRLPSDLPILAAVITPPIASVIKGLFLKDIESAIHSLVETHGDRLERDFDVQRIVCDKIAGFSTVKVEEILFSIMKKEFRFIELVGAVLGFFIGAIQLVMLQYQL